MDTSRTRNPRCRLTVDKKEKELDLRQVLIQEIKVLGKFILARVAKIAVQLNISYAFSISVLTNILEGHVILCTIE